MATMSFSIPDDVKDKFNEAFEGQNTSVIITTLMVRAIEDEERRRRSLGLVERLRLIRDAAVSQSTRRSGGREKNSGTEALAIFAGHPLSAVDPSTALAVTRDPCGSLSSLASCRFFSQP